MISDMVQDLVQRSFVEGLRFANGDEEEKFHKHNCRIAVMGCRFWSVAQLLAYTAQFLPALRFGYPSEFYFSFIPIFIVLIGALLMSVGPLQKKTGSRMLVVVSVVVTLLTVCTAWQARTYTQAYSWYTQQNDLDLVHTALSDQPLAQAQLLQVLDYSIGQEMLSQQLAQATPQAILLIYVGYHRSTFCSIVLLPFIFTTSSLISPYQTAVGTVIRIVVYLTFAAFLVMGSISVTRIRRSQFSAEHSFHQAKLQVEVEGLHKAESILHHCLSGPVTEAADAISAFLDDPRLGDTTRLQQSSDALRRVKRSCGHHHVFLRLVQRSYTLSCAPVHGSSFARDLVAERNVHVAVDEALTVVCDETLLNMVCHNALCNAFEHGHETAPNVTFTMARMGTPTGKAHIMCRVTNRASPNRPVLTEEAVSRLRTAHREFMQSALNYVRPTGIGLQHVFMAAEAHDMRVSLAQVGDRTTFEAHFRAPVLSRCPAAAAHADDLPDSLRICCLDASPASRRRLLRLLQRSNPAHSVRGFGDDAQDVRLFASAATSGAHIAILEQSLEFGPGSHVFGTDVMRSLVEAGYQGLLCLRVAHVAEEDLDLYFNAGAHCVFDTTASIAAMWTDIQVAYVRYIVQGQPVVRQIGGSRTFTGTQDLTSAGSSSRAYPTHTGISTGPQHSSIARLSLPGATQTIFTQSASVASSFNPSWMPQSLTLDSVASPMGHRTDSLMELLSGVSPNV